MDDDQLEPTIPWEDIQGIALLGFNKNHQALIGWRFGSDAAQARETVAALAPLVTTTETVAAYKKRRRDRLEHGREADFPTDVWSAVALTFEGLQALTPEATAFTDVQFRRGLLASSPRLGDPSDPAAQGNPAHWVVGGPEQPLHGLLVIAGDVLADVESAVRDAHALLEGRGNAVPYKEIGHNLAHYPGRERALPSGHEHFGFKDGISQPAPRGKLPNGDFIVSRDGPPSGEGTVSFAKLGQPLVCLGQFLLGYATQRDAQPDMPGPPVRLGAEPQAIAPAWAIGGSFLVFRRLHQDVAGFRQFVQAAAATVGDDAYPPERLAAMVVGRWPDGAPLIRSPAADDPATAAAGEINAFGFGPENPAANLPDDSEGRLCPVAAHIRKVNPRDLDTDQGPASATLSHRLLRRGIAYGPPYSDATSGAGRGLLFLSVQASILNQFEFISTRWMNSPSLPTNPSGHEEGLGNDMLVGQAAGSRARSAYIRTAAGDKQISNGGLTIEDWVIPTGGAYLFLPTLPALKHLAADGAPRAGA